MENRNLVTGNKATALAAKLARIQVVSAYPITPQTTIVEYLAKYINDGELNARMIRVESEHSALSAVVGASLTGARTFTATSSQGLQLMSEMLYLTSGLRLPVIMAVPNRTLSTPVNIWCDHQDALVNRDSGWIQLFCSNVQEIFDFTLCAYKFCEDPNVLLPAMVCYDGFFLSHVSEVVNIESQAMVDEFLPTIEESMKHRDILDVTNPLQFGEVVFPDWYPAIEYKKHNALKESYKYIEKTWNEFREKFDREYHSIESYNTDEAQIVFVCMGSMAGTVKWTINNKLKNTGLVTIKRYRPFPYEEIRKTLSSKTLLIVLDRDIGYGSSGMLFTDVVQSFCNFDCRPKFLNFIVGLGGKEITPKTIMNCYEMAIKNLEKNKFEDPLVWMDIY